jgi:hypothetical protein
MLEYRRGIAEAAQGVRDGQLRRLLRELLTESEEPLQTLFRLAKGLEDRRQNQLLRGDLARLRSKSDPLSATEREQLTSLERLEEATRLSSALITDTQAILGRCYAQTREIALERNIAEGEGGRFTVQLRDQAVLLGQVREALHDVYGRR